MVESIEAARRSPFGDNPMVGARGTQTHQEILGAALAVFGAKGYHESRVEQITEAAGCSRPTFYQYFSSKEGVFRALADHVGRTMVEMTRELGPITADEAGRNALVDWLDAFTDFYQAHAAVFTAFSAAIRTDTDLVGGSATVSHGFGRALHESLDIEDSAVNREVMASAVVTMIVRANLIRTAYTEVIGRERFVDALAALVQRILLGTADAAVPPPDRPVPGRLRAARAPAREAGDASVAEPDGAPSGDGHRSLSVQGKRMRARLIEAGRVVFPRRGFHETRVDDVVTEAGVSHGSFYRYFTNKEDLFGVVASEAAARMIERMEELPIADDPGALRRWLARWFAVYAEHGAIISLWREMEFSDPIAEEVTRAVADAAVSDLVRALEGHGIGDPPVDALAFLGLIETIPHHVETLGYFGEDEAIEALVAIIRRGFLGYAAVS